jgi:hypothetical protein
MSYCGGQLGIQIYTNMKTLSGTIQCLIRVQFTFNQVSGFWEKIFLQFSHRVQCYNFALQWQSCGIFNRHTKKETFVREDKNISKIFFSKLTLWQISSEMVTINIKKTLCLQEEIQTLSKSENMITLGLSHRDTRSYAQTLFWGGSLFDFQLAQKKNDIRQSTIQVYFKG